MKVKTRRVSVALDASQNERAMQFRGSWQGRAHRMLRHRFPFLLARMTKVPTLHGMDHSITRDGLLIERGWLSLVVEMCERLAALTPPSKRDAYQIVQIKEKWGELRIYMTKYNMKMHRILMSARRRSVLICEICGRPGKLTTGLGHYGTAVQTVCTRHAIVYRGAVPVDIAAVDEVLPNRRLRLRLRNGMRIERDFSRFTGGVFEKFVDVRYFRRVRLIDGVLTWPGPRGWRVDQVVDLSPDSVVWGICPAPPSVDLPPMSLVLR